MQKNLKHLFLASLIVLNGCAGHRAANDAAPAAATAAPTTGASGPADNGVKADAAKPVPGALNVVYTTNFPDGSRLKDTPTEIMIVRSETTQKAAAGQTALAILTFAFGGGAGFSGFSKESLKGEKIEDVKDRNNIRNTVSTDFTAHLREQLNAEMDVKRSQYKAVYKHPVSVAGGSSRLIYESLTGEESKQFRMNTELEVYKKKEGAGMFSVNPFERVSCNRVSEKALPLDDWMKDDYVMVRQWMDETLQLCADKVIAALPKMLAR
ncbi:hypothetical protein [Herbaspirillum robiniae]|uniref:Lipoprotein n=1 Tax=Herbaspirillum robiniae TaxID=2014887 RepID=A0A246WRU8_9BURK|nr:hypothetical protein [Herbaspirillum robiniae]OWY29150.1 hypothetical protein CEJ42_09815 [Herbaspirillum robiniae]